MGATATSQEARAAGFWKKDANGRLNTQLFAGLNFFLDNCLREAAALSCGAGKKKKKKKITQELFLHVTSGAVMTPVWLDDLAPVAVADCCKAVTQRGQETTPSTATWDTHVRHTRRTNLRRPCGCTGAGCWQLSTGSPAATPASPPSRSAPCQPWAGRTGEGEAKRLRGSARRRDSDGSVWWISTSLVGFEGLVKMVFQ